MDLSVPVEQWVAECLLTEANEATGKVKQGQLATLTDELTGAEIVLVIPAEQVLLLPVQLPGKNAARLKQALPYALEDQLISDIDEQYFVLGPRQAEQDYAVAVVEKNYLDTLLNALKTIDIYPGKVFPESLLLPSTQNGITLVEDNGRIIVRSGTYSGFACDSENLSVMLSNVINDTEQNINKVICYGSVTIPAEICDVIECETHALPESLVSLLYHDSAQKLDLLPKQFVHKEKLDAKLRQWLPAAAMLLIWVVIQLSTQVYDYYQLKKQDTALQASLEKIYRQTFPDAKRIVNVEVQMRQRLKELRERSGKAESGFTEMLVKSAPILQKSPRLKLQSLRYHDGRMDIELEIRDLQSLEQLKEKLSKTGGWDVEIQSASSAENKVQGRLQVRSSS